MHKNSEIREFLISRREKIQPEDVGLPRGTRRRVPGLRREEVATLAGVSIDYYVQVERGEASGVSDEVLAAIARALRLDPIEYEHLFNLVRNKAVHPVQPAVIQIQPPLRQVLDSMVQTPAIIMSKALDIVAANKLGRALFRPLLKANETPNFARYVFLDDDAHRFYHDWDSIADDVVAMLRLALAQTPGREIHALIQELHDGSEAFVRRWKAHDVREHHRGSKVMHDEKVGELNLYYEILEIPGTPGARVVVYTPDPNCPQTTQSLHRLSSLCSRDKTENYECHTLNT